MGVWRVLLWPIYWLGGVVGDYPLRTAGAIAAVAALVVLTASLGVTAEEPTNAITAPVLAGLVVERPAYVTAFVVGIAVALFFDG